MNIARPEFKTQKRRRQLFILAAVILGVTNDSAELGQRLSGEGSKSSAIEFSHSTANAMTDLSLI
jgi:hypothetical protein